MYAALSSGWKPKSESISVSALIGPPRIRTLTIKHWDELVEDVSDRLWALLGQALHSTLEKHAAGGVVAEMGIKATVDGTVISGRPDFYDAGVVGDYKITSVFSFLLGIKEEWTTQLNFYAHLLRGSNLPVTALNIHAILRDWVENKTLTDKDYPKIPFVTVPVTLWTPDDCMAYIKDRVRRHISFPMDECSDAERWARATTYAVFKVGNKRALRVLDTLDGANKWGLEHHEKNPKDKLEIHERPGSFVRCERFCAVKSFCDINPYNNPAAEQSAEGWEAL